VCSHVISLAALLLKQEVRGVVIDALNMRCIRRGMRRKYAKRASLIPAISNKSGTWVARLND